jgi:uncharacterized protein YutE (UPF0331/DUF86 family)
MADDVLVKKAAIVERSVGRAREEYAAAGAGFATDFTRQDAAVMNIQRACEATVDMANHIVRRDRLGVVSSARESFDTLVSAGFITQELAEAMKRMVGFRNLAVHDYQRLLLAVAERVIQRDLDDLLAFSEVVVRGS